MNLELVKKKDKAGFELKIAKEKEEIIEAENEVGY